MAVNAKLHSVLEYVRDMNNPYVCLVQKAMNADAAIVPFYQVEEVREASFQSDYACEMIMKALAPRLDEASTVTVNKALTLFRVLFLEGASSLRTRMAQVRGSLLRIANLQGVRSGTLEASNKDLAAALLQAMEGNSDALAAFSSAYTSGTKEAETSTLQPYKSEFQTMREKEQRLYRRQCEEEKRQSAVIVKGRVYETFDVKLSPDKLVEQVITNPKKKFARQELDSFVTAATATGNLQEVCAELDRHLQDGRQTLQNRYKVLLVVEALVCSGAEAVQGYFCDHSTGIRRHLEINPADNPVKAEAARGIAQRVVQALHGQPASMLQTTASSVPVAAATTTFPGQHSVPQQQQQQQQDQQQRSASMQIDDLFSDLSFRRAPAPSPGSKQTTSTNTDDIFDTSQFNQPISSTPLSSSSGITVLSRVFHPHPQPIPPSSQQFDCQQRVDAVQQNIPPMRSLTASSRNATDSGYGVTSGDVWHQQQQQQQQGGAPLSGSNGVSPPPPIPTPSNAMGEMLTSGGEGPFYLSSSPAAPQQGQKQQKEIHNAQSIDKMRLMEQLQAQMEATRLMLEQQQAAFLALQAELRNT
ncbi:hypothetical protein DQ04_01411030 [Trypanosoma grayi]|uniref:hypothetical protein n=1 Tax=Trypanosoma grayi TaxID=71804 RepID=UPI0004F490DC|nr:hypothetical protein DQ04_01411030 [Trypanosoma grayi]KEG12801.1 hypothetical protein DQ04_01411030 [Trypanosoma grayi]